MYELDVKKMKISSSSIFQSALSGMKSAADKIFRSANDLSSSFSVDSTTSPEEAIVDLKMNLHAYKASASLVKVGEEVQDAALDILA